MAIMNKLNNYDIVDNTARNGVKTAGTGAAYTATVPGITSLVAGANFTMIPNVVSTTTTPTLNVNSLGAKQIRRRISNSASSTVAGQTANWLAANKPVGVTYDGAYWIVDFTQPNASDIYGTVPISKGGTGGTTAAAARTNLDVYSKGETYPKDELIDVVTSSKCGFRHTFSNGTSSCSIEFGVDSNGDKRGMFDNTTSNAIICADGDRNVIIRTDNAFKVVNADGFAYLEAPIDWGGYTSLGYGSYKNGQPTHIYGSPVKISIEGTLRAFGQNKVLWSGGYYMTATHTATLSEAVSKQPNGIVLVWSKYDNGAAGNTDFNLTFIPKQFVSSFAGKGATCFGAIANGTSIMCKYVYIHDTKIVGNDNNIATDSNFLEDSGIQRSNKKFVLRQVVGV